LEFDFVAHRLVIRVSDGLERSMKLEPRTVADFYMELMPWQRRIEVYSLKIQRRLTLFSRDAHDAWLLLEADPEVRTFCERPAYVAGEAGRLIDFWVDRGRHANF
jgi:hypothetical protein